MSSILSPADTKRSMQSAEAISKIIREHLTLLSRVEYAVIPSLQQAVHWTLDVLKEGNKVLFAGNGGSAADAQHLAAEFIGRFSKERQSLPALALTTDTSVLTALGNDYGFDHIFSRQLEGLLRDGDIFFAISTSGDSLNLLKAVDLCKQKQNKTVGLLGRNGGRLKDMVDLPIIIESDNTARIQEIHILIGHIICELVEDSLFG